MGAIAVAGVALAFLPRFISILLTLAVFGILALDAMRLGVVTERGGHWRWIPWLLWLVPLLACPAAITVIGVRHEYHGPPDMSRWAYLAVQELASAHAIVSTTAAIIVVLLTRGSDRWVAWAVIFLIGLFTGFLIFVANMSTSGAYL